MDQEDSKKQHELRSEEVEDILGRVPSWITRNGIILLSALILLLFAGSWVFRFPKVRKAEIVVTSRIPPADIKARADGKIDALLVQDNAPVKAGQVLAVIENPAEVNDVLALEELLESVETANQWSAALKFPVNGQADLGPVQDEYASFFKNYRDYEEFIRLNYHQRKIELLNVEYEKYLQYARSLESRASLLREDFELSRRQFNRDSLLFVQNVLSESSYETSRADMLKKLDSWEEVQTLVAENEIRIAVIQSDILDMELKQQEQTTVLENQIEESLNRLKASIAQWKKDYLIIAPVSGTVTFNSIWSENQNVRTGERVMTVIPEEEGNMVGKIRLPIKGAGDVRPGQQVNIRFDNYPYLEYGMVRGIVHNVSKVPEDEMYTVEVKLPDGLTTYYNNSIEFNQNMKGMAEILTDKVRLIQRIFNPLRNAVSRQKAMKAENE